MFEMCERSLAPARHFRLPMCGGEAVPHRIRGDVETRADPSIRSPVRRETQSVLTPRATGVRRRKTIVDRSWHRSGGYAGAGCVDMVIRLVIRGGAIQVARCGSGAPCERHTAVVRQSRGVEATGLSGSRL